jgi:hypothetical protein
VLSEKVKQKSFIHSSCFEIININSDTIASLYPYQNNGKIFSKAYREMKKKKTRENFYKILRHYQ